MSAGGLGAVLPVDLDVPGDPPPPLAILHGLLVVTGRMQPAPSSDPLSKGPLK
jgi:Ni,Fe-hydrogenase III small subunit